MKAGRGFLALFAVLAAGALGAPLAHAGSYDVLSCTIDGGYHANNAWVANNNPAGDGRYVTDASCPKLNDPLTVALAGGNAFSPGTFAALYFNAPSNTTITNYKLTLRQYWFAPGNGGPDGTTYELASLGPTFFSGAGQFDPAVTQPLVAEGHWYGNGGAIDTGAITRTLSDSAVARAQATPPT